MKNIERASVKRILVTRIDRMGDVVLTTPTFEALRRRFPESSISVLVAPENCAIVEGNPFINEVLIYDKKKAHRSWIETFNFAQELRRKHFDVVIHFHSTNRMMWLSLLAGIPVRIGWKRRLDFLLTHAFRDEKRKGERHESEYNFDLLRPLAIASVGPKKLFFPLQEKDKQELSKIASGLQSKKYFVLHVGASCPSKRWPQERFSEVAQTIQKKYNLVPVFVGGRDTETMSIQAMQNLNGKALNLTNKLSLGMLAQLLSQAAFLVSNDSGPVHVAASVGCPVLSIFGRKEAGLSPTRWKPLGEKSFYVWKDVGCEICLAHECQIDFLCLTEISTQEVITSIEENILKLGYPERSEGSQISI